MRLGLNIGYSGKHIDIPMDVIKHAESVGFDSVWIAEAYGSDAVSPAAWILAQTEKIKVGTAIMQMPARTPAMCAMTAMTLSQLSGNRFIVGLGASGPQVVEGWHGLPYGKPMARTREYIQIMRKIMAREGPVEFDGDMYQMPNRGDGTTGLGKPLKSILAPNTEIPIVTAQITPAGLACAAEYADGVIPVWQDPYNFSVLAASLNKGFEKAGGGKGLDSFDVAPFVGCQIGDDVQALMAGSRAMLGLYIGGMGAKGKNFYTDYASRLGYEEEAHRIQDLYLAGNKAEAEALVPDELIDNIALLGPPERIRERAQAWKDAASRGEVGTMIVGTRDPATVELLADIFL